MENPDILRNTSLRVYFQGKEETFELQTYANDKKMQVFMRQMPLGESVISFIYGDFEDIYEELRRTETIFLEINAGLQVHAHWEQLRQLSLTLMERHPYFGIASQVLSQAAGQAIAIDMRLLSRLVALYKQMRDSLLLLVKECMNVDEQKAGSFVDRYADLLLTHRLGDRSALKYSTVVTEFLPTVAFPLWKTENCVYPVIPTLQELRAQEVPLEMVDALYPHSLQDLYHFLLAGYLKAGVCFKVCKNCGRYFAVTGSMNAEYCDRKIDGSQKTCRQMGAVRVYQQKQMKDPILRLYNRAYKTHNARIRYGRMTREEFLEWSARARALRDKCLEGKISVSDFEIWLKE
ncbi:MULTISPECIES: DUF6076 domain-containing protein [Caproicibacterium]|uniref:DUF6076 domain-containing protein n=1 Tax=Caproicibacterium argilliputei TaxID=3030016 RepID=A0AA97H0H8_9FIRM|nr:DUF6076 domain-containing protein [Caproicibacterium argilliputei]WOC31546.1 DUF6076 domain-containing protein [Caproicibacterium argilliputei]